MCKGIKATFKSSIFPNSLKLADVTPLHKNGRKDLKENNRPVSILPNLSKVLERIMFAQRFFLKIPLRISESYSTQYCLLTMLENGKNMTTKEKYLVRY